MRVFGDGGERRTALPTRNATLGTGLRWKPWSSQVVYLAAEAQNGLADASRHDVLLRASASFLNGGHFGDDWHPARAGWFSQNLYLDAARYLRSDFSAFTADYRASRHVRIAEANTLEPYAHVQTNLSGSQSVLRDIRAGAGVRWNLWHGGSTYDADPHKLSLGLEFQQAFQTYLTDRNGLFLTVGSRW
jgi:adsorption protein A